MGGDVIGSDNQGADSRGGENQITNSGTVGGGIIGSRNSGDNSTSCPNTITNSGQANSIIGSSNMGDGASGGGNTIANSGTVTIGLFGSSNIGANSSGGENTITNSGTVTGGIYGTINSNADSSGGGNNITNSGKVDGQIYGTLNNVDNTVGSDNTITNSGTVTGILFGSANNGDNSSGGSNTIDNSGTVGGSLYGSLNSGDNTSGDSNTITNSGTVGGTLYGSMNTGAVINGGGNTITNAGAVNGLGIYGSFNMADDISGGSNTITNTGSHAVIIIGSENFGDRTSGGGNTITNNGTAQAIVASDNLGDDSSGSGNTITNTGNVVTDVYGNWNSGDNASGGGNTINNSGAVGDSILGSYNDGAAASGGSNTITNSGSTGYIDGTWNVGDSSSGGGNTVSNSGSVAHDIFGACNDGAGSSGGSNEIDNSGTVTQCIYGTYNFGASTSGGSNTIYNSGTVTQDVYGTYNEGANSSGGGNYINNSGRVGGGIYGTYNEGAGSSATGNTIINNGSVGGGIYAGSGNDTVRILSGSSVRGVVDGQAGTDSLYYGASGVISSADFSVKYLNFENLGLYVDGDTTLTGTWVFDLGSTVTSTGTLTLNSTLDSTTLNNAGTATFNGDASFSGAVVNTGRLSVSGSLSASSISNSGSAVISGAASAGSVANSGSLNVSGSLNAGAFTNSGSAIISGTASIGGAAGNSGSLNVNGTLTAASLLNSGTLSGSGTINALIINTGVISPGNSIGTLSVAGPVTFEAGSSLNAELACDCSCDLIAVSGAVTINGGSININLPKDLYFDGTCWNIITADGGVTGIFDDINGQLDSEVLSLSQVNSGTSLSLVLARESYGDFGATANQRAVGRGLDAIVPLAQANEDTMAALLLVMDWQYDADQIRDVLAACNPEMYDGLSWAALQNARLFDGIIQDRADWGRTAAKLGADLGSKGGPVQLAAEETGNNVTAEPMQRDWSLWARAMGSWNRRSGNTENLGYDSSGGGAVLGADGPVLPWLRLGMAFAAGNTDVHFSRSGDDGTQKSVQGGLYAMADLGAFYLDASLSYSGFDNDTDRAVAFGDASATAKASFDASAWSGRVGGGWDYQCGRWIMGPRLDVGYLSLSEDGFRESGADFLDLNVDDRDADYWSSALGLRAAARYDLDAWALLPRLDISWRHLFSDDARGVEASFRDYPGQGFTVYGLEPAQDALQMQAGVRAVITDRANAFLQYGLLLGDDVTSQDVSLGFNWMF